MIAAGGSRERHAPCFLHRDLYGHQEQWTNDKVPHEEHNQGNWSSREDILAVFSIFEGNQGEEVDTSQTG